MPIIIIIIINIIVFYIGEDYFSTSQVYEWQRGERLRLMLKAMPERNLRSQGRGLPNRSNNTLRENSSTVQLCFKFFKIPW